MANTPIVNDRIEYVNGLELTHVDDENITVSAGACSNSDNVNDIVVASALTVDISVNGANGLDTGSAANSTMYAVYAIGDSTGYNAGAAVYSLASNSAPSLPYGYDMYRRIGYVLTDGTADLLAFIQYGDGAIRNMYYDVAISELAAGASATYAEVDLATSVPPIKCRVHMKIAYTPNSATNDCHLKPFGSSATDGWVQFGCGVAAAQNGVATVPSDLDSGVPKILYKVDNGSDALTLIVQGYEDIL